MKKAERQLISDIAHEAFTLGRVYARTGEKELPGEMYNVIERMISIKINEVKIRKRIKARHKRLRKK